MYKKNFLTYFLFSILFTFYGFAQQGQGIVKNSSFQFFDKNSQDSYKKFNGWKQAETNHFRFIFEEETRSMTELYGSFADEAWNKIGQIYAFPQEKTNVYLTGRTNIVNAFTYFSPAEIVMFNTPVYTPDFTFRENWANLFFTHELIHIANINFEDKKYPLRTLIGSFANTINLSSVPGWAMEGLTTVLETELTKGGRGRSPYFELLYKAPTLDNAFISYNEIDTGSEPPYGQSYVMGYLIMRSIADRWGIKALADIERNRSTNIDWEDSVKLVTGQSAENIYKDVKIALSKKYASERLIPEGITITPRNSFSYFYQPAAILEDGSFITLRSFPGKPAAIVQYNPALKEGSSYISEINPEEDLNTVFSETILFTGDFQDETSISVDKNQTVYVTMASQRADRIPGYEIEYALYSWTKDKGLKKLTNEVSLFQPTVNKDGSFLIASQVYNNKMRLVLVNPQNGNIKPILQDDNFSFIQPSINEDGTKLCFMSIDDSRGRIAVCELPTELESFEGNLKYTIVANNEQEIYDPSYPSWNSDGKLTFTCNYRSRLEVFELDVTNLSDISKPTPVVSDPIGALWAYKTDRGIYYLSYASNGYVLKMKPLSQWGVVPETEGPSKAGNIITFGELESDYPDFVPYEKLCEIEIEEKEEDKKDNDSLKKSWLNKSKNTKIENESPIPIKGKTVKHRTDENIKKAEELQNPESANIQTILQNEKKYFPFYKPLLYIPVPGMIFTPDEVYFGAGYSIVCITPRLQLKYGISSIDLEYFPELNNFTGNLLLSFPIYNTSLDLYATRNFSATNSSSLIKENNSFILGMNNPLIYRKANLNEIELDVISSFQLECSRLNQRILSLSNHENYDKSLFAQLGMDFYLAKASKTDIVTSLNTTAVCIGYCDFNNFFFGEEIEAILSTEIASYKLETDLCQRYTNFPQKTTIYLSRAQFAQNPIDCSYPGHFSAKESLVIPSLFDSGFDFRTFGQLLIDYGFNSVDYETPDNESFLNYKIADNFATGFELSVQSGKINFGFGYRFLYNFDEKKLNNDAFYFTCKYNWLKI